MSSQTVLLRTTQHLDGHTVPTHDMTPRFKPFTMLLFNVLKLKDEGIKYHCGSLYSYKDTANLLLHHLIASSNWFSWIQALAPNDIKYWTSTREHTLVMFDILGIVEWLWKRDLRTETDKRDWLFILATDGTILFLTYPYWQRKHLRLIVLPVSWQLDWRGSFPTCTLLLNHNRVLCYILAYAFWELFLLFTN